MEELAPVRAAEEPAPVRAVEEPALQRAAEGAFRVVAAPIIRIPAGGPCTTARRAVPPSFVPRAAPPSFMRRGNVRRTVVARPDGRVIVTNGVGHGYVQRPFKVGGRPFVQRTYYVGGARYARFYRPLVYRDVTFSIYEPARFYSPRFYAWTYTPWPRPVIYSFGWGPATPRFGFYGGYFAPYPSYAGPNYWLTDYMLAASLQEARQERLDANNGAPPVYDPSGRLPLARKSRMRSRRKSAGSSIRRAGRARPRTFSRLPTPPRRSSPTAAHMFLWPPAA